MLIAVLIFMYSIYVARRRSNVNKFMLFVDFGLVKIIGKVSTSKPVCLLYAETVWGVTVAGASFHARNDAGTSVLLLMPGRTTWLKLKDQHCLSDNV